MADKLQNTSSVKTNTFNKGMVKDYSDMYLPEGAYTHAINAINNTHYGELGTIGNEPANRECASTLYAIIGFAYKGNGEWILFSTRQGTHGSITNATNSDIGIFNETTCSYESIFNKDDDTSCLDFAAVSPITAVCKENYDCTFSVYWQDAHNPDRVINLTRVPYIPNPIVDVCVDPDVTQILDCNALRLHPLVTQPCLKVEKALGGGQLINGSYMAFIAYSENGIRLTDYSMPSAPVGLWAHEGIGGSLDVLISNADSNFTEFELVIVATVNQQTIAKKVGNYPINIDTIHLDQILQSLPTIDLAILPMKNVVYEKSDKMFEINNYLIRSGVTSQPYFNYQPLANQIRSEWVAIEYDAKYYWHGGTNVGYMRDEVYAFFIRWVYATGARSASYHIPGRAPLGDRILLTGEFAIATIDTIESGEREWQVHDTSTKVSATATFEDGGVMRYKGTMSYWESTERYPNNTEIWADLCSEPIRHHKMPSDVTIDINTNGGDKIYVLGVQFNNILPPIDENGDIIEDIVGYEILRASREGNKSVVAKGLFNNMLEYDVPHLDKKGLIQNYPYNDVRPDSFLTNDEDTLTQSSRINDIINAERIDTYSRNMFSFHSPETNFLRPYLGNTITTIYGSKLGEVIGKFEKPYEHPDFKLITDFAFGVSGVIGVGIGLVAALGKTTISGEAGGNVGVVTLGSVTREGGEGTIIPDLIAGSTLMTIYNPPSGAVNLANTIAGATVFVAGFAYFVGQGINQVLDVIRNVSGWRNYLTQYNSHGFYNSSIKPNYYRTLNKETKYIGSGLQDFDSNYRINNLNRNKYVAVNTLRNIAFLEDDATRDKTKKRMSEFGLNLDDAFTREVTSVTNTYYGAIKIPYDNQYGQLDSCVQIPVFSCVYPRENKWTSTSVIFGGDVYINRYTEKNPYMFFNTWLKGEPNGIEFNYRNYINGPIPRFWLDSNKFDISDVSFDFNLFNADPVNITFPSSFHRLDTLQNFGGLFIKKNAWMYLFYNGVRDFFVESELNIAYRDYGEDPWEKFYDVAYEQEYSNLQEMFRSDLITKAIYYNYDMSLSASKLFSTYGTWGRILPRDYDPQLYNTCFEYYPRRVIYSLKQVEGLKRDNWRNYLPLNYRDFNGKVSVMKSLNATGAMILFEDHEPILFNGVDQLESTSGNKFLVGDGGLFANVEQTIVNADDSMGYGECISSRSAVNTPFGLFWISQKAGKILNYSGNGVEEITRNGMKFWFNENLPSRMLEMYPDFPHYDNPIIGVACQTIYDPQYELLYFIKKDHLPLDTGFTYTRESDSINVKETNTTLLDVRYFENATWVASYDPKTKSWISFHTWKPSLVIPSLKHFFSVNPVITINENWFTQYDYTTGNTLWKHNDRWDDYCRYYDEPDFWEIEYPIVTPNQVTTFRNVEYTLEYLRFSENGKDILHILDENFNRAMIYNSEQISGWLYLNIMPKNNPIAKLQYPTYQMMPIPHYEILYSKEENRYKFNQFWDITDNRGEFTPSVEFMFTTEANGYMRYINNTYTNYNKPITQRKKFRHYGNKLLLRATNRSNGTDGQIAGTMSKMVLKLINNKLLNSPR